MQRRQYFSVWSTNQPTHAGTSEPSAKMTYANGEIGDRVKDVTGAKVEEAPILKGTQLYHNSITTLSSLMKA
jgi:hypothetical protein